MRPKKKVVSSTIPPRSRSLEQETIAAFNKRFPFVKVEIVHAPGGQLIERIRSEVAANKLTADLIDHSEPGLLATMNGIFRDYRPPNAEDYIPATAVTPRLYPTANLEHFQADWKTWAAS